MSEIPSADYAVEFNQGSVKAVIAAANAKSGDLWMVPIDNIVVPEGLNVRIHNEAYEDRIEEICDSIMVNGFFRHMPLSGYAAKEGVIYVTGGFTRLEAAKRASKRGALLQSVPVVLHPAGTSMADIQVNLVMDNTNNPLKPYERGIVVKRLARMGFAEKEIAEKLAVSQQLVNRLLYLHSLPQATQQLVMDDQISAHHAVSRSQEVGPEDAAEEFQALPRRGESELSSDDEAMEKAGSAGRVRPKAPRAAPTGPSKKVMFAAIDYAIALEDIAFLIRWRKNEADAVAEVAATLKRPKAIKAAKKRRRTKAQIEADKAAAASIGAEADRQEYDGL